MTSVAEKASQIHLMKVLAGLDRAREAIIEARRQTNPGALGETFEQASIAGLDGIQDAKEILAGL